MNDNRGKYLEIPKFSSANRISGMNNNAHLYFKNYINSNSKAELQVSPSKLEFVDLAKGEQAKREICLLLDKKGKDGNASISINSNRSWITVKPKTFKLNSRKTVEVTVDTQSLLNKQQYFGSLFLYAYKTKIEQPVLVSVYVNEKVRSKAVEKTTVFKDNFLKIPVKLGSCFRFVLKPKVIVAAILVIFSVFGIKAIVFYMNSSLLTVQAYPWCYVKIDDKGPYESPFVVPVRITAGKHGIIFMKDNFQPVKKFILVQSGKNYLLQADLERGDFKYVEK